MPGHGNHLGGVRCAFWLDHCLKLLNFISHVSAILVSDYRTWENFGGRKFWRIWRTVGNSPKFSPPIFINARVFNRLSTDSPNFSSPKTLEPLIRQKFPPPKFSHVRYSCFMLVHSLQSWNYSCQNCDLLFLKLCRHIT